VTYLKVKHSSNKFLYFSNQQQREDEINWKLKVAESWDLLFVSVSFCLNIRTISLPTDCTVQQKRLTSLWQWNSVSLIGSERKSIACNELC
jgi:hypothetical protein